MASVNTLEYLLQKYEMGDTLGTGAFSDVKVATERATGNKFAIKIVDKTKCKGKESMIETEVSILMRVKHENIVQLYEMYEIENKIYLVMELVTGGELFDEIVGRGKYSEVDAAKIVYRILLAINYLHGLGIAHRDLKPENLLLSDKTKDAKIMISDFGLSKIFNDDEVMRTACGTPGYVAPEVLRRQGYGREIDLWSLGVITYILLCGYPPFYDQNNVELFKQIMTGKYEFDKPWWDNISDNAKDFIRKLLVLDPHARSTARTALSHPFILEHCGRNSVHQALPQKTAPRPNASTLANQHEQYQQQQQLLHHQQQQQQLLQQQQQQQQNLQLQQKQQQEYYNAQYHQQQVQFQQQQHYAQYQQQQQQQQQQQLQQQQQQQDSATQQPQHGYIYIRDTVSRARRTRPNAEDDQHAQSADDYLKQHQQESGSQAVVDPGRPLGNKTRLDDSGCVTSNEQVNRSSVAQSTSSNNAKWAWKKWF